jgi:hypothetical protein
MRNRLVSYTALAAMLVLVLVAAGCGSSSKSSSTSSISKAEFLKKGNAICRKGDQQINQGARKVFPKSKGKPSQAQMTKFAKGTLIPSVQSQIDGIKSLGAPKGDEAKVKAIVTGAQAALDKGKKNPAILVSNKQDPFAKTNKLAHAYGLTACGGNNG